MPSDPDTIDTTATENPDDSTEQFAADLRRLKDETRARPSVGDLANLSGTPKSTLSAALRGEKLPSEKTLVALVTALEADPRPWLERRERLRLATLGVTEASSYGPPSAASASWLRPRWLLALLLAVALIAGGAIGATVTWQLSPHRDYLDPGIAKTGDDPAAHPACLADATVGAAETRLNDYLVEIIWSANCRAGWGRITRYDGRSYGNRIAVTTYLRDDPDGPSTQYSDDPDAQSSYTYLIATRSPQERICVKGAVTDGTKTVDLTVPLCL